MTTETENLDFYWLHIAGGTMLTQHGPFATESDAYDWREPHYGSDEKEPSEPVPGGGWDDYGSDTWVLCSVARGADFDAET